MGVNHELPVNWENPLLRASESAGGFVPGTWYKALKIRLSVFFKNTLDGTPVENLSDETSGVSEASFKSRK